MTAWRHVAEFADAESGLGRPWRLPSAPTLQLGQHQLATRVRCPSGVYTRVTTDARALRLDVDCRDDVAVLDVLFDGVLERVPLAVGPSTVEVVIPVGTREVQIWLPHRGRIDVGEPTWLGGSAELEADRTPDLIAYGSSITQGHGADGPTETWPARLTLEHGIDTRNLGFSSECHLDPAIARWLATAEAASVLVCAGINIYGQASFSARTLRPALLGFLQTVRAGDAVRPLVVVSPICSPSREDEPNAVGLTLSEVRTIVHQTVEAIDDPQLILIDGRGILGPGEGDLLFDGLHPNSAGYAAMAERLAARLA